MQFACFGLVLLLAANGQAQNLSNIVDTAVAANFTILAEALTKADLVTTLKGTGPFTVFAPTDAAFAAALTALKVTKAQLLSRTDLAAILKYHVVSGTVKSTALTNGMTPATLQGATLAIAINGTTVKVNTATVAKADVMCSNGVIHIIDQVLLPPAPTTASSTAAPTAAASTADPAATTSAAAPAPAAGANTTAAPSEASAAYTAQGLVSLTFGAILSAFFA